MKQLSGQDNSFLEIEKTGIPQHIASVAIYDQSTAPGGKVRFKDILAHLKSRMHLSEIFSSKLQTVPFGMDRTYLVDDENVDLEYHVRHIGLPSPGDWRQFCILLARINARPLDLTKPLWEAYIIEGLDNIEGIPKGSFALLLRVHHSVMDGASGSLMIAALHDFEANAPKVAPPATRIIEKAPSNASMLASAYVNGFKKPRRIFQLGKKLIGIQAEKRQLDESERTQGAQRKVQTRFNQYIGPHRVLDAVNFDFAEVREIKNTLPGATINDAMLAIVSGGLHKYLDAKGELPEETLTCGCPIDVRDESEKGTGGNVVGFMGVNLMSQIADPVERFEAVHHAAQEAKANAKASDVRINKDIMDTVPGGIMATALRVTAAFTANTTQYNVMLTNVPGPPNSLYFAGAQIVDGFGIGPLVPGVGLFHTACSAVVKKKGKILLSFWADRDMLPDPEFYRQCIQESYAELRKATLGR